MQTPLTKPGCSSKGCSQPTAVHVELGAGLWMRPSLSMLDVHPLPSGSQIYLRKWAWSPLPKFRDTKKKKKNER